MADDVHAMTLRLPRPLAEQLALVAQIDGLDVAAAVRQAVTDYIAARIADPGFRVAARNHITDVSLLIGELDA
ncbi:hypothetical protein KGA66_06070 [Actinocrinis puniceicyclus]|uniref:Uncharacterized protein n=1 Tax=Actinocrinis puniceicyclus TaxID=977794 RepID=A0A8J8BBL8_9ACTN|nr:hypothetical protein [Actinocrinis puniceicyclus]MBS2962605.1 hypothetical protein [Actinocrinis puniceicyclus]